MSAMLLTILFSLSCIKSADSPLAKSGEYSIPGSWMGEVLELRGNWLALEGLRDYKDFENTSIDKFSIPIPSTGSVFRNNSDRKTVTLFLRIQSIDRNLDLSSISILTKRIWTAHKVYVNGNLIIQNGIVGPDSDSHSPRVKPILGSFSPSPVYDVLIQISNFTYINDGMLEPPLIGSSKHIYGKLYSRKIQDFVLIIFLLLIGLVNIGIFYANPRDKSSLVYAILILSGALHVPFSSGGDRNIIDAFPELSYFWVVRLEGIAMYSFIPLYLLFVRTAFKDEFPNIWLIIYAIPKAIAMIIGFSFSSIYFQVMELIIIYDLLASQVGIFALIKAVRNNKPQSKLFLFGFGFIGLCFILDYIRELGSLPIPPVLIYGFPVMTISHSLVLAYRVRFAFNKVEELTKNLQASNEFLEERVEERTQALSISMEQIRDANRLKDRFLSIVSHDIRSPLSGVSGALGFIIEDQEMDSDSQKEFLISSKKTIDALIRMTSEILAFARNQNTKILPTYDVIKPFRIWQETTDKFRGLIKDKQLTLVSDGDLETDCLADATLLGIVFTNLLSNAIKFSKNGGEIHYKSTLENFCLVVSIADDGIGLNEEVLANLFSYGLNRSSPGTKGEKGTGFGLPFTKELLDAQNIDIFAKSESGKGSIFELRFQIDRNCVMIIDENDEFRDRLKTILKSINENIFVISKEDGKIALEQLERIPIPVIITNYHLPGMNGTDLIYRTKEILKTFGITPKIAMFTSFTNTFDIEYKNISERAKSVGANLVLIKDIPDSDIRDALSNLLIK
jgi:signal transduction histidine kinase/CheY-like chemotaxis protein